MAFEITERVEYRQFNITQGDTLPPVRIQILDDINDSFDLTDYTVHFLFRKIDNLSELLNRDHTACTIIDVSKGIAQYDWVSGDTDLVGIHYGDFQLIDALGRKQSYPQYLRFNILPTLDAVSGIYL